MGTQRSAKVLVLLRALDVSVLVKRQRTLLIYLQLSFDDFDLSNRVCSCGTLPIGSMSLVWNRMSNYVFSGFLLHPD